MNAQPPVEPGHRELEERFEAATKRIEAACAERDVIMARILQVLDRLVSPRPPDGGGSPAAPPAPIIVDFVSRQRAA
jgi:hypothetical protein